MSATIADLEKQIAALKTALDGKKDKKSMEQESQKYAHAQVEMAKKQAEEMQKMAKLEARLINLEVKVNQALAMAAAKH